MLPRNLLDRLPRPARPTTSKPPFPAIPGTRWVWLETQQRWHLDTVRA